jgi:hypothetical protein
MGDTPLLMLLPPSEGKAAGGTGAPWEPGTTAIDLDERRSDVMAALARAMRQNQAARTQLLGVRGTALATATLTAVSHWNKLLKGALVRFLLAIRVRAPTT